MDIECIKQNSHKLYFYDTLIVMVLLLVVITMYTIPSIQDSQFGDAEPALVIPTVNDTNLQSYSVGVTPYSILSYSYSIPPIGGSYDRYTTMSDNSSGIAKVSDNLSTTAVKFIVDILDLYPPSIYENRSGGIPANYSFQSNFYLNASGLGGRGLYFIQTGFYIFYRNGSFGVNNFSFIPWFEWWWPGGKITGFVPFSNLTPVNVGVGNRHSVMLEGWEYTGYNASSGDFVNVTLILKGYMAFQDVRGESNFADRTVWYNLTYSLGTFGIKTPLFVFGVPGNLNNGGIGILGGGNGQVVNASYSAFETVEVLTGNMFVPPLSEGLTDSISGEGAVGIRGEMIMNESSNPLGLPPYTPYAYLSNSLKSYNVNDTVYFPMVVSGYVFPANSTLTAFDPLSHEEFPVMRQGNYFSVNILEANSFIPMLTINTSSPNYRNESITYYMHAENMTSGILAYNVFIALTPVYGNDIYGYVEVPFPYVAYLIDNYIQKVGWEGNSINFWHNVAINWDKWFPLNISSGGKKLNLSWYYPNLFMQYGDVIYNWTQCLKSATDFSYYENITSFYLNSPLYIPYYFSGTHISTINVTSLFLSESFPVMKPGEYNITQSMLEFQISFNIDSVTSWYLKPNPIGSVVWDGQLVWVGDSDNASFSFIYKFPYNSNWFNLVDGFNGSELKNVNNLNYSVVVQIYSYSGNIAVEKNLSLRLFNYSIVELFSPSNRSFSPLNLQVNLGGNPFSSLLYVVIGGIGSLTIILTYVTLKRKK
ncbi:MAG: hypothetical protein QXP36_09415 [Conexivisphaerales archaeon]